jgi:DNA sulfur modification protein DndE
MIINQIRLSNASKDKLSRLKGRTGIRNWNILCRWAFCYSLSEGTVPTDVPIESDSNVEMSWYTFAGEHHELYEALIKEWCREKELGTEDEVVAKYFRLHLERGIGYLSGTNFVKSLDDLLLLAITAGEHDGNIS